jgi:phosphate transport system substrate-binding protein
LSVVVLIPTVVAVITGIGAIVNTLQVLRPSPRRRLSFRVHLDAPIGARPDIKGLAELVVRRTNRKGDPKEVHKASLALVRISNDGGLDIGEKDYVQNVTFTFGERKVVGVEVKDVTPAQRAMLLGQPDGQREPGRELLTFSENDNWVRLPKMQLNKKDRFRMLVLLSGSGTGVDGSGVLDGAVRGGGLVRDTQGTGPNRATIRAITFGMAATASLLSLVLVLLFLEPSSAPAGPAHCVAGDIRISGSTAFAPSAMDIASKYHESCSSSTVGVNPSGHETGSNAGVLDLATKGRTDPAARTGQLAMSDGRASGYPDLVEHPIAVVIFSVVVNKGTGIHSLTTDQLKGIYSGQLTNWAQLGGRNVPISVVSRGTESGTRSTFDQKVLDGAEPPASSYNCTARDPKLPSSPVTRCELSSTESLLDQVNSIPGAIGYAEKSPTSAAQPARYQQVDQVQLNGRDAAPDSVKNHQYPFWAVEYFYTYGAPAGDVLLSAFLDYLASDPAKTRMQNYGHIPCTDSQGNQIDLCR